MASDRDRSNFDGNNKSALTFTVGSHIKCRFQREEVEGEVAAFQSTSRLLLIRSPSTNGKSNSHDMYLINTDCVDKVSMEDPSSNENLKPIDFVKLTKRREKSIGSKQSRIKALAADVSPEGKKLFLAITKTIEEVVWDDATIVVLNEVRISPPYQLENVQGEKEASVVHLRKIVEKFWKDQNISQL